MRLEITFAQITPGILECDCRIPATLKVYAPGSDYAGEDGFVCVACEFCKAGAVRMIDGRKLLPIVPPLTPREKAIQRERERRAAKRARRIPQVVLSHA